jgi:hypothetical protein
MNFYGLHWHDIRTKFHYNPPQDSEFINEEQAHSGIINTSVLIHSGKWSKKNVIVLSFILTISTVLCYQNYAFEPDFKEYMG